MKRNKFSLSHYKLFTCDMGYLIPITWFDVLPGDSVQMQTSLIMRLSPLMAPIMHPCRVRIHHWFVPLRIIWDDFEDFITGGEDGTDSTEPPYRTLSSDLSAYESYLYDYLGLPPYNYTGKSRTVSALPLRAYGSIFNEWYRDQDLVAERTVDTGSGADSCTPTHTMASVAWEKDYFTASRPWESKGDSVIVPLGGESPVTGIGKANQNYASGPASAYETDGSGASSYADYAGIHDGGADAYFYVEEDPSNAGYPNIRAQLASGGEIDLSDLRLAIAVQRYQEARARYGSRYSEYLRYLGVSSRDGRLKVPEYLGGGRQMIQFSEVLHHGGDAAEDIGAMKGHGLAAVRSNRYRRFFDEHGIVMSLMSVVPKAIYCDGIPRKFLRTIKEDYYQRELENIGDQEVLNQEVYALSSDGDGVFGYQQRYDEYRTEQSSIAGEFRSTLDHWHLARIFGSEPSLNSSFVTCAPSKRIFASESTDGLYCMANHSIQARRLVRRVPRKSLF